MAELLFDIRINLLSPNKNKHLISPYSITTTSNLLVMSIKETIIMIKDEMSWCLIKFSQLVL